MRAGGEAVLIDSPYFPDELEALPALLAQAGFEPDGLLATHGDFDHLLGRLAFPGLALGVGEPTAQRLRAEPGAAQRELRDHDDEHYVARPAPLSLGAVQAPAGARAARPGRGRARAAPGGGAHRRRLAVFARALGLLVVGDYLSDVEIPMISRRAARSTAYRATLARLAPLVEAADTVVPGHGSPHERDDRAADPRRGRGLPGRAGARGGAPRAARRPGEQGAAAASRGEPARGSARRRPAISSW